MDVRGELRAALTYALQRVENGVDVRTIAADAQRALGEIEAAEVRARSVPMTNHEFTVMTLQDGLQTVRTGCNLRDDIEELIQHLQDIAEMESEAMQTA